MPSVSGENPDVETESSADLSDMIELLDVRTLYSWEKNGKPVA